MRLTDDDSQDDQDNDDQNYPQLHILPPQLALQTSGRALEHISILVQIIYTHTHTHREKVKKNLYRENACMIIKYIILYTAEPQSLTCTLPLLYTDIISLYMYKHKN